MLKVSQRFLGQQPAQIIDTLTLPYELRKKGRFKAVSDNGEEIGVFIERGKVLSDGELLITECGKVLRVCCESEPVMTASSTDWVNFSRVCYHLGNRHVPLQIGELWVRFQPDHVLAHLVQHYGLHIQQEEAPFDPENGAYGEFAGHHH